MEHKFEHGETGIQFTGSNLIEVGDFLNSTHYEFTGDAFVLPSPAGDVVVKLGEWLVKREDGTFRSEADTAVELPKKRGKKK